MLSFMARPLRIEYSGAVYHVMARGDEGKFIFIRGLRKTFMGSFFRAELLAFNKR